MAAVAAFLLRPDTHNGQAAGDGDVDEEEEEEGEEPGRTHLVRSRRWFEGMADSDQAAVSPQAEAG